MARKKNEPQVAIWYWFDGNELLGYSKPKSKGHNIDGVIYYSRKNYKPFDDMVYYDDFDDYDEETKQYDVDFTPPEKGYVRYDTRATCYEIVCSEQAVNNPIFREKVLLEYNLKDQRYEFVVTKDFEPQKKTPDKINKNVNKVVKTINFIIDLLLGLLIASVAIKSVYELIDIIFIHPKDLRNAVAADNLKETLIVAFICTLWSYTMITSCINAWINRTDRKKYLAYREREMLMLTLLALPLLISIFITPMPYCIIAIIFVAWVVWGYFSTYSKRFDD